VEIRIPHRVRWNWQSDIFGIYGSGLGFPLWHDKRWAVSVSRWNRSLGLVHWDGDWLGMHG